MHRALANCRTDLVVVTSEDNVPDLERIGCSSTATRKGRDQSERCVIRLHVPLKDRTDTLAPVSMPEPLIAYHRYIDLMLCLAEYDGFPYDAVIHSDLDTFLMPGFGNWTPPNQSTIMVGTGGYGHENANAHLAYVSRTLKLDTTPGMQGLGSTWFGETRVMAAAAQLTVEVIRWLHTQEFTVYERCCSGVLSWPYWHWAVLLLYGGHVALNQVGSVGSVVKAGGAFKMDHGTTATTDIGDLTIKHAHCWHTDNLFSKFHFGLGNYDKKDFSSRGKMSTVVDYVTVLAVSSIRLSDEELARLATDAAYARDDLNWKRLKPAKTLDSKEKQKKKARRRRRRR